jgi:hypothetical protein
VWLPYLRRHAAYVAANAAVESVSPAFFLDGLFGVSGKSCIFVAE